MSVPTRASATCPVCGCRLEDGPVVPCAGCETPHHADCWAYNGGCAIYGCSGTKPVARAVPAPPKLPRLPARDFVFTAERFSTRLSGAPLLAVVWSVIVVLLLGTFVVMRSVEWTLAALVLSAIVLGGAVRDRLFFEPDERRMIRRTMVGPIVLRTEAVPLATLRSLSLDPGFDDTGAEQRRVVRAVLTFSDGRMQRMTLDLDGAALSDEDVSRWADLLRRSADVQVTRAPAPRLEVLLKRIASFERYLGGSGAFLGPAAWYWERRWVALLLAPVIPAALDGHAIGGLFAGAFFAAVVAGLTAGLSVLRPGALVRSLLGGGQSVNPYPDPLMYFNEDENLQKLGAFLTTVEEKEFPSQVPEGTKTFLRRCAVALAVGLPLVIAALFFVQTFHPTLEYEVSAKLRMVLGLAMLAGVLSMAGLGALLTRAMWEEDWARGWLSSSRSSLEQLLEHKHTEAEKKKLLPTDDDDGDVIVIPAADD